MSYSYDDIFGANVIEKNVKREDWGVNEPQPEGVKRKRPSSFLPKKKAKISHGDELVEDPESREAAKVLLAQVKSTPGIIKFDVKNPKTPSLVPMPSSLQMFASTKWNTSHLAEGQLKTLLALPSNRFSPMALGQIKGKTNKTILNTRGIGLPTIKKNLKQQDKSADEYVGFAAAVANVLRRCEIETGESVANTIAEIIEQKAIPSISKQ